MRCSRARASGSLRLRRCRRLRAKQFAGWGWLGPAGSKGGNPAGQASGIDADEHHVKRHCTQCLAEIEERLGFEAPSGEALCGPCYFALWGPRERQHEPGAEARRPTSRRFPGLARGGSRDQRVSSIRKQRFEAFGVAGVATDAQQPLAAQNCPPQLPQTPLPWSRARCSSRR